MKYTIFKPEEHLAEKGVKNWTKKEATEYFNWFLKVKDKRVDEFLKFFDISLSNQFDLDLNLISKKLFQHLTENREFTDQLENGRLVLNKYGYSVIGDFGLLLSKNFETKYTKLKWVIGGKPKSYHSYNLPVLEGFENGEWDFIFTSIQKFGYAMNHINEPYDWSGFYNELIDKIKT